MVKIKKWRRCLHFIFHYIQNRGDDMVYHFL